MTSSFHMGISVRGLLNQSKTEMKRTIKYVAKDDGSRFATIEEFKDELYNQIAKGREVLPMGKCPTWDYKTGCPGHPTEEPPTASNNEFKATKAP